MYQFRSSQSRGNSLIEMIIYIGLIALIMVSLISFGLSAGQSRAKVYVVQEVQANLRTALEVMSDRIRMASSVNTGSSTFTTDPGVLNLVVVNTPSENPTILSLSADNGRLQITQGVGTPEFLTSDDVNVTNLVFTNQTGTSTHTIIGIDITVAYNTSAGGGNHYQYSASASTAVSLRQ